MKTMKYVLKRTAIAANPSQSGNSKQLRLRELSTSKYSPKWVQVNDSLIFEVVLYPRGTIWVTWEGGKI